MLHSVAELTERETGEKMENDRGGYFMTRDLNPREIVVEAMALRQPAKGEA